MAEKRPALGKGLSALIPDLPQAAPPMAPHEIDLDLIAPNALQPRRHMDEAALDELAQSIREHGVMQPILVRPADGPNGRYEIIAGERRWRAALRAGLLRVPVVVRDVPGNDEQKLLQLALIENIQREDLNPIEEAVAYQRLIEQFGLTQEHVALAVHRNRSSVANTLRLLKLPEEVRRQVIEGRLTMGHARALLSLDDPALIRATAAEAIEHKYSVREVEARVNKLSRRAASHDGHEDAEEKKEAARGAQRLDANTLEAQQKMKQCLGGLQVQISRHATGGHVRIDFGSEDDLQKIYERITGDR